MCAAHGIRDKHGDVATLSLLDYSENVRVLVDELKNRVKEIELA